MGRLKWGETLTADTSGIADADGMDSGTFSYQWIANDGTTDAGIRNATSTTYMVSDDDAGKHIKVSVAFTDDRGNMESLTSTATAVVVATKPAPPGNLNVSPHDTGALDVDWDAPASDGGSSITAYRVQWREAADVWDPPTDVSEETVSATMHTIIGLTDGVEYAVRVRAINDVGESPASAEKTGIPRETRAPELGETQGGGGRP